MANRAGVQAAPNPCPSPRKQAAWTHWEPGLKKHSVSNRRPQQDSPAPRVIKPGMLFHLTGPEHETPPSHHRTTPATGSPSLRPWQAGLGCSRSTPTTPQRAGPRNCRLTFGHIRVLPHQPVGRQQNRVCQMKAPLTPLCLHNLSAPGTSVRRPSFNLTLQGHGRDQATTSTAPCEATCNSGCSPWLSALRPALVPLWPPGHYDNQDAESPAHHIQMQGRPAFRDFSAEAQFPSGVASKHHTLPEDVDPHPGGEPPHGLSTSLQEPLREADWTPQ